jgi:hypothetical protein
LEHRTAPEEESPAQAAKEISAPVIHQIPLPSWLRPLWDLLEWAPRPEPERRHSRQLWQDLESLPPLSDEDRMSSAGRAVPRVAALLREQLHQAERLMPRGIEVRGAAYYPEGGGLGWHTNSDVPGWRLYVVRAPEGRSYVRTSDGVYQDQHGRANLFRVTGPESWHCVGAVTERWTLGLLIPDELAAELLERAAPRRPPATPTSSAPRRDPAGLEDAVRQVCGVEPASWRGTLHLHLGGKTGETIYASGCFPAIRQVAPFARIALHLHPHYLPVVPGLEQRPDEAIGYEPPFPEPTVALQVTGCLRRIIEGRPRWWGDISDLHTSLYMGHGAVAGPFYRQFHRSALGLPQGSWRRPGWDPPAVESDLGDRGLALVIPTANEHAGIRELPVGPADWRELAAEVRARGLLPAATGHPDDGCPDMPGWTWIHTGNVISVLELLYYARRVVGPNSGIVWSALLLCPGRVTMFDWQRTHERLYDFADCPEVVDQARHFQLPGGRFNVESLRRALL